MNESGGWSLNLRPPALALAAVALSACLPASSGADEPERQQLMGRHVVALFHEESREYADIAVAEADELADSLPEDFGLTLDGRSEIVICRTHAEFEEAVGTQQGIWVLGIARPDENRVLIKELPLTSFAGVVRHEIVHLFMGEALGESGAQAPRWLHEGAAKYYSGDWSANERSLLAGAARGDRLHSIDDLAEFPTHPDESALAYAQSYVLVEYLASLDPANGLAGFIAHFKKTGDVERAFRRAYGRSPQEIEEGWHEAIKRKTRSAPFPWAAQTIIFFVMVLIFGVAFIRVRRRSRKIRERMEQEELLERLFDETRRRSDW